jgi:hypothetical protein
MPVLRGGVTADEYYNPDIYFEEQEPQVPEKPVDVSGKVMLILGQFQKGSPNEIYTVIGEKQFKERLGQFLDAYPGSKAAYTAFKKGIKKLICVPVWPNDASAAFISLQSRTEQPADSLKITLKSPGRLGDDHTCEVANGTAPDTFRIILNGPGIPTETYDNVKSIDEAIQAINLLSNVYQAELIAKADPQAPLAVIEPTRFTGGSDGNMPQSPNSVYKGGVSSSTGEKTGLALAITSAEATDIVADIFVSDEFTDALLEAAEKKNAFGYAQVAPSTSVSAAINRRNKYDTEFAHLALGYAKSRKMGWWVPVSVYDCIAHILTPVQDGTAGFTFADVERLDVMISDEESEQLTKNHVVHMGQMIDSERNTVFGMKNDYTLSTDPRYKQTYRRRVTSLIETDYYIVMRPYRSVHLSSTVIKNAELATRNYFDELKKREIAQDYSVSFTPPEQIGNIDELIEDLVVDLYNIADKIRIRLLSAANAM